MSDDWDEISGWGEHDTTLNISINSSIFDELWKKHLHGNIGLHEFNVYVVDADKDLYPIDYLIETYPGVTFEYGDGESAPTYISANLAIERFKDFFEGTGDWPSNHFVYFTSRDPLSPEAQNLLDMVPENNKYTPQK